MGKKGQRHRAMALGRNRDSTNWKEEGGFPQHLELHHNPVLWSISIPPAVPCCHGNREADSAAKEVGQIRLVAMEMRKGGGAPPLSSGAWLSNTPSSSLFLTPGMEEFYQHLFIYPFLLSRHNKPEGLCLVHRGQVRDAG